MLDKIKQILTDSWDQIVRVTLSAGVPGVSMPMVMDGTDWKQVALAGVIGLLVGHLKVGLRTPAV